MVRPTASFDVKTEWKSAREMKVFFVRPNASWRAGSDLKGPCLGLLIRKNSTNSVLVTSPVIDEVVWGWKFGHEKTKAM